MHKLFLKDLYIQLANTDILFHFTWLQILLSPYLHIQAKVKLRASKAPRYKGVQKARI
jgi:hypothetical protein